MEPTSTGSMKVVESDWPFVLTLLPQGWEQLARETKAFLVPRAIRSPAVLLRLVFVYAVAGLSLRNTVFWAEKKGLACLSEVALLKRLRAARLWLARLLACKLAEQTRLSTEWPPGLVIRLRDATCVSRPGSRGTDWRLHVDFDLSTLTLTQVELTDARGGESFQRLPVQRGALVVGDRGHAQRAGIAAVAAQGGWVLVRLNWQNVPLWTPAGQPFDLFAAWRSLAAGEVGTWAVQTAPADGVPAVPGRIIAVRKSPEAAEAARRQVRQAARRKGNTPTAQSLEAAEYLFLFTTTPEGLLSAAQVLEVYRFRWQIELAFKRMKSLLALDVLPAHGAELAQTILLAKLLAAVLVDELSHRWVAFSPWGYGPPAPGVAVARLPGGGGHAPASHRRGPARGGMAGESQRARAWAAGYSPGAA